ncbi:CrcB family protein [Planomonospora sp. ID91781]|uniref:FluC/FEX family fluoride channel n=1 Tax=Planomonospora sp. ID91781 TaxID=2738135 RepID=UPI0018C433D7|nr:CrcB family protein [Planomonospora sp. ID91781]MBG0821945.1 CrcB family protein [Planomonospora sp. ID91781]
MSVLLVALGGAAGAALRHLAASRSGPRFPWGILAANTAASFLLGLLAAGAAAGRLPGWALTLGGAGFCGALSTYSTLAYDVLRLAEAGERRLAAANLALTLAAGLAAAFAGAALGRIAW